MPKILINIPDEEKAQEFLQYFVPNLSFIQEVHILENEPEKSVSLEENQEPSLVQEPLALYNTPKHSYTLEDIQAIAGQFPSDHRWTYTDLQKYFPQNLKIKVEILNHQLLIMPSPEQLHQDITFELCAALKTFVRNNQLGDVIIAPFDVILNQGNVVIPDVIFVSVQKKEILDGKKAKGAPDLVVEVWSPGNKKKERETKKELYASNGILEFWEVYAQKAHILVEVLDENGAYQIFSEAQEKGAVHSKILAGFSIQLEDIFQVK
ncbi:MAG: Uma2 family endonuclease [Microscillaceae bacterium]|nr:Uma2 family endonuclease [Microscillaceae bacterium]